MNFTFRLARTFGQPRAVWIIRPNAGRRNAFLHSACSLRDASRLGATRRLTRKTSARSGRQPRDNRAHRTGALPDIAHMAGSMWLQVCASVGGALGEHRHTCSIPLDLQRPAKVFVSGTLDASTYLARVAHGDVNGWRAARCRDDAIVTCPDAKSAVPDRNPLLPP